jgi:hypothetical protein
MNIHVKKLIDWTIPMCGNRHSIPYGVLLVTDGKTEQRCKTKNDLWTDHGRQYIVFMCRRYYVINNGSLYYPALALQPDYPPQRNCQCNGWKVRWSNKYEKWQTVGNGRVYEQFTTFCNAVDWCWENRLP